MFPRLICCFPLLALFAGTSAQAACEARFEEAGRNAYSVDYDPFVGGNARIDVDFVLGNPGTDPCQLELSAVNPDGQQTLANGLSTLPFAAREDNGWNVANSGNVLAIKRVQLPAGARSARHTIVFEIPREQVVSVGRYQRELRIRGRNLDTSVVIPNERMVSLAADVLPRVQAKASFNAGAFDAGGNISMFDLGVLRSGLRSSIYLKFRGTTDANVTVTSQNGGSLRNEKSPTLTPIPYEVELNGVRRGLASPLSLTQAVPRNRAGTAAALTFIVSDASGKLAGIYKDVINISVVAN